MLHSLYLWTTANPDTAIGVALVVAGLGLAFVLRVGDACRHIDQARRMVATPAEPPVDQWAADLEGQL